MTYDSLVVANLRDLLGPEALINRRVNLVCAYAEIESLFSNLLPDALLLELAGSRMAGLGEAIPRVASDCGCLAAVTALRDAARDARRHDGYQVSAGALKAVIGDAERFVNRIRAASVTVPCPCGARVPYRLHDVLSLSPPIGFRLTCSACATETAWFIPNPRH